MKPPSARLRAAARALTVAAAALCAPATVRAETPRLVPPAVLTHVDAEYPPSLAAQGKHLDVVLAVTVDAEGHVAKIDVMTSGGPEADLAAVAATRQWTFKPGLRNGTPAAMRIPVPFHFSPPTRPVDAPSDDAAPLQGGTAGAGGSSGAPLPSESAAPPVPSTKPEEAPQDVSVFGAVDAPTMGAADVKIDIRELARVPRENAAALLKLAPGILLTNEGGEGHAEQVFLRGFDAREGQDIEFTLGNIPFNEAGNLHGNGYADAHFIIPELVQSLRVIEGPFDPRQGNFAVAGSANYELGLERRGFASKLAVGSFGTERLLLLWGPPEERERTFAGAEIGSTSGYGRNRDARHATAMAQYEGRLGEKGLWRLTANAYSTQYHSAGVIRQDDYLQGRVGFYDTTDARQGGSTARASVAGEIISRTGDTTYVERVWVTVKQMRLLENFTGFLLDTEQATQSPHDQRGDLLDLSTGGVTIGSKGAGRWHTSALGFRQDIELGYFARGDVAYGTQDRLEAATSVPYKRQTDVSSVLGDLGLYADVGLRATKWLSLRGGVRADLFTFDVHNNCATSAVAHPSKTNPQTDVSCLSQQDFGRYREPDQRSTTASPALMPRATLTLGPFAHASLAASYGRGVRSIDPAYVTQDVSTPFATVDAYEGGVTYAGMLGDHVAINARSSFFATHVDRDLLFSETAGRNVLGDGTTRTGWVGALRLTGSFFDQSANVTVVKSTFDDTHLLVPYVPDVVVRSDSVLHHDLPFLILGSKVVGALGVGVTYVGRRPLPYGERSDEVLTVDASSTLEWRAVEIGVTATNLTNRQYRLGEYNYASDVRSQQAPTLVPVRHFTAGAPLGIFATLALRFGGKS